MLRTRGAILSAAEDCLARQGVRATTMGDVAAAARVAKATLYNHFRAKDDVLAALVQTRAASLAAECERLAGERGLAAALEHAAAALAASGALRRVAADEAPLLLPLAVPGQGRGWEQVRKEVATVLAAAAVPAGPVQVELVLRWLLSHLLWPPAAEAAAGAAALARAVTGGTESASAVPAQGTPAGQAHPGGLGWPS